MLPNTITAQAAATVPSDAVASSAEDSNNATLAPSDTAPPTSLTLEQMAVEADAPSVTAPVLPPHPTLPTAPTSLAPEPVISKLSVAPTPQLPSSPSPSAAVAVPPHTLPQTQAPVQVQQILQHSRPIDLTPSTPAARVIDEVVAPGHGVHDRQAMMNNLGVHPAVYQYTDANGEEDSEARSPREIAYARDQPGARASPLVLDVLIGALSALLAYAVIRRFL
jgi:hypothetical protein